MEWNETAIAMQRAAVRATERWGNKEVEALNRVYLAALLESAGYGAASIEELDRADRLFRSLPQGETITNLQLNARLRSAEAVASGPNARKAVDLLNSFTSLPEYSSLRDRMRIQQALGVALQQVGDFDGAAGHFHEAIRIQQQQVQSLSEPLRRLAVAEIAAESFRKLTQIQLLNAHDAAGAFRTWELYRNQPVATKAAESPVASVDDPASVSLTFAVLPAGVAVWLTTKEGSRGDVLSVPEVELERDVKTFHRLCASPSSNLVDLRSLAHKLHFELLAPYWARISKARRIVLQMDMWLSALPFRALIDDEGNYLGDRFAITMADRNGTAVGREAIRALSPNDRSLIVSVPTAGARAGLPFLKSAEAEASELASRLNHPVVLRGRDATIESVAREIPAAKLFHFAGHAWSNAGNAGLLLPTDPQSGEAYLSAPDIEAQDWSRCELAVLSACLTASGEERGPVNPQSLVRALLAAGVRRVIASRWSVDSDATHALMTSFYDELFAGASPVQALHQATARVRSMAAWSHPYYWAAFDVFGAQ